MSATLVGMVRLPTGCKDISAECPRHLEEPATSNVRRKESKGKLRCFRSLPLVQSKAMIELVSRDDSMSIERTILLVVGVIVLGSVFLAAFHSMNWLWVTGAMGAHLIQASFTGMCPVVMALKRMGLPSRPSFG
ncbi:YgaP family membrane protein [Salinarimonas ramus]|nr:DUF2892 domain-containing protein [Salinarimonas ramus]